MKISVDNPTLIHQYLKGQVSLLANQDLRIEPVPPEIHLFTKDGKVLVKGEFSQKTPKLAVRRSSTYWPMIHHIALEQSLLPLHEVSKGEFLRYEYCAVPAGFSLSCEEASGLWKQWWLTRRKSQLMDLLLCCRNNWYPVRDIVCSNGFLYVKTWAGELVFGLNDITAWISRQGQNRVGRWSHPIGSQEIASTPQVGNRTSSIHPFYWNQESQAAVSAT